MPVWQNRVGNDFKSCHLSLDKASGLATEVFSLDPMESGFQCAACGEWNSTSVDESVGRRQSYVEDCQVCCKPNLLRIEYDTSALEFFITAELE
jgi:hypothetical protein